MENDSEFFCSDCGEAVNEDDVKCPHCGAELSEFEGEEKLNGLKGWLIIPMIGLIIGLIACIFNLIKELPLSEEVEPSFVYTLELLVQFIMLAFMLYAGFQFFRKRKNTPQIMMLLLFITVLIDFILLMAELISGADDLAYENGRQLFRDIIYASIWIPYFNKSMRVKFTFVN